MRTISLLCAVIAAILAAPTRTIAADVTPTLALVGPETTPIAVMSPNGRYFALVNRSLDPNEDRKLLFIDSAGEEAPIVAPLGKDTDVRGLVWANDDRVIFVGSQRRKVRISNATGRIEMNVVKMFSIDRRGADAVPLFENSDSVRAAFSTAEVLNILPDDPDHIIMSAVGNTRDSLDLWKVNVKTGKAELLFQGIRNTFAWHLDETGAPAFRTTINDRGTYIMTYVSPDKGETWELVHQQVVRDTANEAPRFLPLSTSGEGRYTIIAQRPGADRIAVHEYDLRKKSFIRTLYEHPTVDVSGAITDPMTGAYLGAAFAIDRFEYEIADPDLRTAVAQATRALGEEVSLSIIGMSRDRQRIFMSASGPQAPGDYYLFDRRKKSLQFLFSSRPELDPAKLSPVEIMRTRMSDGVTITSYVTHPNGDAKGVYPLLVVPHGGPQARDYHTYDLFGQYFASRGYRVIQTNFRGSAGYGEAFVEAGHREWGKRMQADVMESAAALIDRGIARKKNMCVYGWSYGGYVAMTASFKNADMFSASISTAGVSDLRESLTDERMANGPNSGAYRYWSTSIGDFVEDREDLDANSAAKNAKSVTMPVLLFHGKDDRVVSVRQSEIFRNALESAGKPVEYHEFAETGHGIASFANKDLEFMFNRIDAFCKENLPKPQAQ